MENGWPLPAWIIASAFGEFQTQAKEGYESAAGVSQFAHETPVLRIAWSSDGRALVSTGEDRLVKIWNAETMTIRQTLEKQSDWASGLAIGTIGVAQIADGSCSKPQPPTRCKSSLVWSMALRVSTRSPVIRHESERPLVPLAEVPPEVDYGPQPAMDKLPKVAEAEPNDRPEEATEIATPGVASGRIFAAANSQSAITTCFAFKPSRASNGLSKPRPRAISRRWIRSSKCSIRRPTGAAIAAAGSAQFGD